VAEVDLVQPLNDEAAVVAAGCPPLLASTSGPFSLRIRLGFGCHACGRGGAAAARVFGGSGGRESRGHGSGWG
jgi:hypothetical protein